LQIEKVEINLFALCKENFLSLFRIRIEKERLTMKAIRIFWAVTAVSLLVFAAVMALLMVNTGKGEQNEKGYYR
jgi:hypothetical protein